MKKKLNFSRIGTSCLFAAVLAVSTEAHAASKADKFMQGEPLCFAINPIKDNPWTYTLKLVALPLKSGSGVPIAQVSGLMHGTVPNGSNVFNAGLTGTATIAPANGEAQGKPVLEMGLVEADFSPDNTNKQTSGIWVGHYGVVVDVNDLTGKIVGQYSYTPITESAADPGPQLKNVISEAVKPIPCAKFDG